MLFTSLEITKGSKHARITCKSELEIFYMDKKDSIKRNSYFSNINVTILIIRNKQTKGERDQQSSWQTLLNLPIVLPLHNFIITL